MRNPSEYVSNKRQFLLKAILGALLFWKQVYTFLHSRIHFVIYPFGTLLNFEISSKVVLYQYVSCNFVCHSLDFVIIILSKKVSHWLGHGRSGSGVQWLSKEYLTILWIEVPVPQNSTKKASFNNMILITFLKNRYELRIDPNTSIRFPSSPNSPKVFSCFRNLSK